jgi:hypothetical protein
MSAASAPALPVSQVAELQTQAAEDSWLIRGFWAREAVGIIGGQPKSCKSWLGLDMAVSVASGTACLGRFSVDAQGPVLIYLAEDALPAVRSRVLALCRHRRLDIAALPLFAITTPCLRLDLSADQRCLHETLKRYQPRLLLLDPLIRLHRLDENSSADISKLLGYLRELQRTHHCAVVLVHHASKRQCAQPGQTLRGSSDLHAFGDANAYLARRQHRLVVTLEHRASKPPNPFEIELRTPNDGAIHLAIRSDLSTHDQPSITDRLIDLLGSAKLPQTRSALRNALRVNNDRLGKTLLQLHDQGRVERTPAGWVLAPTRPAPIHPS